MSCLNALMSHRLVLLTSSIAARLVQTSITAKPDFISMAICILLTSLCLSVKSKVLFLPLPNNVIQEYIIYMPYMAPNSVLA